MMQILEQLKQENQDTLMIQHQNDEMLKKLSEQDQIIKENENLE
jgi:hypothetical protein